MNRRLLYPFVVLILVSFATVVIALPVAAQALPEDCPLPTVIYWSPTTAGNDSNSGLSPDLPVRTDTRARELAAQGGGCVYLVIGETITDTEWRIQADVSASGHPLAKPVSYGLLLLLALSLIGGGIWARRRALQLQSPATV